MIRQPINRLQLARHLNRLADATVDEALAALDSCGEKQTTYRLGITGAPGVGKSSLIARLLQQRLVAEQRIAVFAIDPTSPFSRGAILGDRVRMQDIEHPELYLRSFASRVNSDGLADNFSALLTVLEDYDFDEVVIETVGAGQANHGVARIADTTLVVVNPNAGDQLQAMKAGILETADIYVVNKADLPGAKKTGSELQAMLAIHSEISQSDQQAWQPPVILTHADDPFSLEQLNKYIEQHRQWRNKYLNLEAEHKQRLRYSIVQLLQQQILMLAEQFAEDKLVSARQLYRDILSRLE